MLDLSLGHTQLIRETCNVAGLSVQAEAYVLATAYWETNRTMLPVEEAYYLGAGADGYRKRLRYYPWHGRGFVQLTWERNYIRAGQAIGVDLISRPELAMDAGYAAEILVIGMIEGWFTGKKLADYIRPGRADYTGARRIINGTDAAASIAAIALDYENRLSPPVAYASIRRGSRGQLVVEAQRCLVTHGHPLGEVDGVFGDRTEQAARDFQRKSGLKPDGIIGPLTWAALLLEE